MKLSWRVNALSILLAKHYTERNNDLHRRSKILTRMIERKYGETKICMEDRSSDVIFSDLFPKKRSDHESQKSGFRFDLKNPLGVWILWIRVPLLDFSKKTQNPFLDSTVLRTSEFQ